jgi:porin
VDYSFQTGASYVGLIPGRDIDTAALGLSHAHISDDLPGRTIETVVEAAYEFVMSDNFIIQPSMQWVSDPGATGELDDALLLGLRVKLSF